MAAAQGTLASGGDDPYAPPLAFVPSEELQGDAWWAETAGSPFDLEVLPGEPHAAASDAGGAGTATATAGFPALVAVLARDAGGSPAPFEAAESPSRQRFPWQLPRELLGDRRWSQPVVVRAAHMGGRATATTRLLPLSAADRLGLLPQDGGSGADGATRSPGDSTGGDGFLAALGLARAAGSDAAARDASDAQRWALGSLVIAGQQSAADVMAAVGLLEEDRTLTRAGAVCWEGELLQMANLSAGASGARAGLPSAVLEACARAASRALYAGAFLPRRAGATKVHVTIGGSPVRGSPFAVQVLPGPLEPSQFVLQEARTGRPLPSAARPLLLPAALNNTMLLLARDAFGNVRPRVEGTVPAGAGAGAALRIVVSAASANREIDVRPLVAVRGREDDGLGQGLGVDATEDQLDVRGYPVQEGTPGAYAGADESQALALALGSGLDESVRMSLGGNGGGIRGAPADENIVAHEAGANFSSLDSLAPLLLVGVIPQRAGEAFLEARGVQQGAAGAAAWGWSGANRSSSSNGTAMSANRQPEDEMEAASLEGPYPALVIPGPADAGASVVAGTGTRRAAAGVPTTFLLQPRDAFGNPTPLLTNAAVRSGADALATRASIGGRLGAAPPSTLPAYNQTIENGGDEVHAPVWALAVGAAAEAGLVPLEAATASLRFHGVDESVGIADAIST